jgi:hypothetical protein
MIISRGMLWVGHVACVGERRSAYRIFVGTPEGKSHLEDLGMDGKSLLKWICKKWDGKVWIGLVWLRMGTRGGLVCAW